MNINNRWSAAWHRLVGLWMRIRGLGNRALTALTPAPHTATWIRRISLAGVVIFGAWMGGRFLHLGLGVWFDPLAGVMLALVMLGLVRLILALAAGLYTLLARLWTPLALAVAIALGALVGLPPALMLPTGFALALLLVLAGISIALFSARPPRPVAAAVAGVPALAGGIVLAIWAAGTGGPEDPVLPLVEVRQGDGGIHAAALEPGPYTVGHLTYGSGNDRHRPEYGAGVTWTSQSVNGRIMLDDPQGLKIRLRNRWWGFDLDELPVNGRVWYPENADGPLPLVLVVHGNHDMMRFSDPGYAWLGEHLASRGHMVVSVDQNFLNGSIFGGLDRENATRGWLLLKHLEAWRDWQSEPGHPLHEAVDLDRVVLIGHSRGGEAVALAAAFNRLEFFPEDAQETFAFGFGIRGVAAIAPVDGQFWPSGKPTELKDLHYFTLHGGHDADVSSFVGDRQHIRVTPDPASRQYRASLYIHHANHGQFNTVWGNTDMGGPARVLLNRDALLDGEEQRQVGKLYLTAFAEDALEGRADHLLLFCNPDRAGTLLPPTLYAARCDDGRRQVLADFEEDMDLETGSLAGSRIETGHLDLWAERDVGHRGTAPRRQTGAWLGWNAQDTDTGEQVYWSFHLAQADGFRVGPESTLWLDLAQADRSPPARKVDDDETDGNGDENDADSPGEEDTEEAESSTLRDPVRIQVRLEDREGRSAARPLSDFATLYPPLPVRHTRMGPVDRSLYQSATEPVLQSIPIPLAEFSGRNGFNPEQLETIRLEFDAASEGVVILERLTLQPDP